MEPFIDGGLFEILIALSFAYVVNYVFLKRYLLLLFSIVSVAGPVLLIFLKREELYFWITGLCIFNSILLVLLLWKQRRASLGKPLFDVEKLRSKLSKENLQKAGVQALKM